MMISYLGMICSVSALGGLLFGLVTGIIAGAAPFIQDYFQMSDFKLGVLVSTILLAASLGAITSGAIIDKFGRKVALGLCALLYMSGSILSAVAATDSMLIMGRFVVGLGLGISSYVVPMYISEIAPKEQRGVCVMINSIGITSGFIIAYLINYLFAPWEAWRWMFGVCAIPALGFGIGLGFLPESPRWLVYKHKLVQAQAVLHKLMPEQAEAEIKQIQSALTGQPARFRDLFQTRLSRICYLGLGLAFMQQVCGINTIFYYAPILFEKVGFKGQALFLIPFLVGTVNLGMTVFALKYVDRWGRRVLLLKGLKVMCLSLLVMAFCAHYETKSVIFDFGLLFASLTFVGSFAMSIGCLFWLLISELYPLSMRAKAMGLMTAANWLSNFSISISFLPLVHLLGLELTFAFYALACMISFVLCKQWVPETRAVPLESIQANLLAGKKIRDLGASI